MSVPIPGLSLCPVEDDEEFLNLKSFTGSFRIPESQKYGLCRNIKEFTAFKCLRSGMFGTTYRATEIRSGNEVILKDFEDSSLTDIVHEINALHAFKSDKCKHVNIIQMYDIIAGESLEILYLAMENYECSLADIITERSIDAIYDESKVKQIMQKLLCALEYIHDKQIMLRSLNPRGIYFNQMSELKIGNFENARERPSVSLPSESAIKNYLAPELLLLSEKHDTAVDIWSAGCIFAELLLKGKVFDGRTDLDVINRIFYLLGMPNDDICPGWSKLPGLKLYEIKGANKFNYIDHVFCHKSESCTELLRGMFIYYPPKRLTAEKCHKHVYFQEEPCGSPLDLTEVFRVLNTGI